MKDKETMKKLIKLLSLTTLLFIGGCSQDSSEVSFPEFDPTAPITLVGRVDNESLYPGTRGAGPLNGATATSLAISLFRADETFTANYLAASPTAATITAEENINDDGIINTGLFYLANREKKTRLLGVAPQVNGTTVTWNANERKITYPAIDGATDIVASTLIEGSKDSPMGSITFGHLLTQIKVNIQTTTTMQGKWGVLTGISIAGKKQGIIVTLPAANTAAASLGTTLAVATAATGTPVALPLTTLTGGTPATNTQVTTTETFYGQAMFAPQLEPTVLTLNVTTADGSFTAILPEQTYLPGMSYTVPLNFLEAEIIPSDVTITPWTDATGGNGDIWKAFPSNWDKDIDWSKPLVNVNLSEQNCYMVPAGGQLLIPISRALTAAKTPEGLAANLPVLAEGEEFFTKVLWTENADVIALKTETQASTQVTTIGKGPGGYILVKPGGTGSAAGNAGLALQKKNADGTYTTLWSWHIWVTNYAPNPKTKNGWMDRNLGATTPIPSPYPQPAFGFFYQWGRKDPFPADGTPTWWNKGTVKTNSSDSKAYAIQNPMTFITTNWRGAANNSNESWRNADGSKTIYDPCPEGYRVPAYGAWGTETIVGGANLEAAHWLSTANTSYDGQVNALYGGYYPLMNRRSYNGGSLVSNNSGYYWSSTHSGTTNAGNLFFKNEELSPSGNEHRSSGFSVRCVAQ